MCSCRPSSRPTSSAARWEALIVDDGSQDATRAAVAPWLDDPRIRYLRLHPPIVAELAAHDIHLHFYGDFTEGQWRAWIAKGRRAGAAPLHLHANVAQDRWVAEFSRYDAGWLHCFASRNGGDLRRDGGRMARLRQRTRGAHAVLLRHPCAGAGFLVPRRDRAGRASSREPCC